METKSEETSFKKTVRIGMRKPAWTKVSMSVFCTIEFDGKRLSITGEIGPTRNGNAVCCGQLYGDGWEPITTYAPGWNTELCEKFLAIWGRWHLNDMRAGTREQEISVRALRAKEPRADHERCCAHLAYHGMLWAWLDVTGHLHVPAPGIGGHMPKGAHKYGSARLFEAVPADVLQFLRDLPDADRPHPWENIAPFSRVTVIR